MKKLIVIMLSYLLVYPCWAGWDDHSPVPVNSSYNPGLPDPHYNSGGRRIVRINDVIIAICPHSSNGDERTYRSTNNGSTWSEIDVDGRFSGCLITGPEQNVYHFYKFGNHIYMVKFHYNATPPEPVAVFEDPQLSQTTTAAYGSINAIVDRDGVLYVATHWGSPDALYVIKSEDGGQSWSDRIQISSGSLNWYYPHLEVTSDNELLCSYSSYGDNEIHLAISRDRGETWEDRLVSNEDVHNPSIITVGGDSVYIFAQSNEDSHRGLVFNQSEDNGNTWRGWELIDPTCAYADPSAALGFDGRTIYVAFRSSNGTQVNTDTCGNRSRARVAMSTDLGLSWNFVDDYYEAERVGTRFQMRYQTWWNYGGPLEWIWMQYEDNGSSRPIYYDINSDVEIFQQTNGATNKPPVLHEIGFQSVSENQTLLLQISATDADGDTIVISVQNLPPSSTFDSTANIFTWTPTHEQVGQYELVFRVTDDGMPPLSDSENVAITVFAKVGPPDNDDDDNDSDGLAGFNCFIEFM